MTSAERIDGMIEQLCRRAARKREQARALGLPRWKRERLVGEAEGLDVAIRLLERWDG